MSLGKRKNRSPLRTSSKKIPKEVKKQTNKRSATIMRHPFPLQSTRRV
jgi:hypothetical protein